MKMMNTLENWLNMQILIVLQSVRMNFFERVSSLFIQIRFCCGKEEHWTTSAVYPLV